MPSWQVTTAAGATSLPVGGWLETGDRERASFNVADIGQVILEPRTRLRLLNTRVGHHSLELARGTMHATIWAPPNQFFVETPSTLAVDLGCAYTLTVDDEGAGLVSVLVGWVGFKWHEPRLSYLEGVFSRGDRRLADVILAAYRLGCRFDGWSDQCRWDLWQQAFTAMHSGQIVKAP